MKVMRKFLLIIIMMTIALMISSSSKAYEYEWPIGGENVNETYMEYCFYGKAYSAPYKDGKSGREYIVDNSLWPDEQYYYVSCESHYGIDITGKNGNNYDVVSVSDGTVIATSGTRVKEPSVDYIDRNKRRTSEGISDGGGYGNYIVIEEAATGRCLLYAHLRGGSLRVSKGDSVSKGQVIATMGSSGDSGHMNLHFEIRKSKANTVNEDENGNHYLVLTNSNTNLDPEKYIEVKTFQEETINEETISDDSQEATAEVVDTHDLEEHGKMKITNEFINRLYNIMKFGTGINWKL